MIVGIAQMAAQLVRIFNDKTGYMYHNTLYEVGEAVVDAGAVIVDVLMDAVFASNPVGLALGLIFDGTQAIIDIVNDIYMAIEGDE